MAVSGQMTDPYGPQPMEPGAGMGPEPMPMAAPPPRKPAGAIVLGIIFVIFGLLGILGLLGTLAFFGIVLEVLPILAILTLVAGFLAILELVAGIGLIMVKNWGRILAIVYAIISLIIGIIQVIYLFGALPADVVVYFGMAFLIPVIIGIVISLIIIIYLTRPGVVEAFDYYST